ncbi:S-adenosyl-L-methionine-dependent methyltransferase [Annulohypoxylon maeteangense]|uniref:S-adenosyl-L-methionine-dependent methyltransferase n=1 Tax=Annulohypoxylon maeteangense TaxID=1927788 RepID=UPI0020089784|nr:S-adenosyl-L-methionine-dependent methyltransferase [Annulohypoxylon maeteangense]KAI0880820.1 S-adenosyl-L-methionine-dependent methyltransferase [Annulohypoxylon maeteangense]
MSLYHETADILSEAPINSSGGNLKTRIFGKKDLKSPQQQVYALALETCKWSPVLKEVIDNSELLRHERKLSPLLALLLAHDFLLSKRGIVLPATHGLRISIERHKARLNAEFTRARLRRKAGSIQSLREQITTQFLGEAAGYPRWVRVNTLKTTVEDQLATTFTTFTRVLSINEVTSTPGKFLHVDDHIPNLLAISPGFEITKTEAYTSGALILQDKASCFPAYLLDPRFEDGDVIDSCSAPGNKTTHLAAIVYSRTPENEQCSQTVYAFEKDPKRSRTLEKMVKLAGAKEITRMSFAQDFLRVDPNSEMFANVGCLLLDPSCSGSGIVGRDDMPTIHLPETPGTSKMPLANSGRKRKRGGSDTKQETTQPILVDDDGKETIVSSENELKARLEALSSFQLTLLLHAFKFPAAKKITYSTCSIHPEENEQVVLKALQTDIAEERGWRVLRRNQQVRGMREWPVRGSIDGSNGDPDIAEACIRSYKDDGRGVMGFFVAAFVRDVPSNFDGDGPYLRDDDGRIIRDVSGMPTLKPEYKSRSSSDVEPPRTTQDGRPEGGNDGDDGDEDDGGSVSGDIDESGIDSISSDNDDGEWNGFTD